MMFDKVSIFCRVNIQISKKKHREKSDSITLIYLFIDLVKIIKIKLILKTITIVLKMKNLIKSKHIRWFQRHHKRIINLVKIKFKEK